jgi:uncharacterized protein YcnI
MRQKASQYAQLQSTLPGIVRVGAVLLAAAVLTLVSGAVAEAHVQVIPDQTAAGSESTKLTFRVPTESETAGTTSVSISLPTDTPLAEVLAEPISGWTVSVKEAKLPKPVVLDGTTLTEAPSTVTWKATKGHQIGPGQFQEFVLSAGPIPDDAKVLAFPVIQTYSDGKVVKWNQPQPAGADEPEFPLPSFTVTAAVPEEGAADAAAQGASATPGVPTTTGSADASVSSASTPGLTVADASDSTARGLGAAGLVVGVVGLAFGLFAWRRAGSRS